MLVYVLHKTQNRRFHVVVVQKRQRQVQKSVIHVQSCCLPIKPIFFSYFVDVLVAVASLDLKVPIVH